MEITIANIVNQLADRVRQMFPLTLTTPHPPRSPIYHQRKSTYFTGVNRALCQRISVLKKLRKLAVGAKKS